MADMEDLISLVPSSALTFELEKDASPRLVLKVTNTSQSKIIFKVKTTQPSWYYVRPNQQMVDVGQSEEVAIALVDSECNRVLEQYATLGLQEKLEKHRFLVMSKAIDDADFNSISAMTPAQKAEEFTKLWAAGSKDDKRSTKLRVEYKYPVEGDNGAVPKNPIARLTTPSRNAPSSSHAPTDSADVPGSPKALYGELTNLKTKYDAVVEYTVHLTAERDMIVSQLEILKREYNKEINNQAKGGSSGSKGKGTPTAASKNGSDKNGAIAEKPSASQGFSLLILILVGILFFVLGTFYSRKISV